MMLAAKHFDPIIGIDIHIIQPPGPVPPVPIPHPFIGMVIDPFDYVPILGSTVLVNGIHRAQAGTAGKCLPSHIPIGGTFIKPPGNEGEIFMGSSTVSVDGDAFSYLALPSLTCQDVGMPPPPRPKKKSKTKSLVLPTSVVLPIPAGPPVLVGGAPTISLMALGMKAGMAALGRLGRGLRRLQRGAGRFGRAMRRVSDRLHSAARRAMDRLGVPPNVRNRVHRSICSVTGHPVDVATGKVFTEKIDLELPGPIPFKWERVWYSTSTYNGPLGHGWHHAYDLKLVVDDKEAVIALRMSDGRSVAFPKLALGQEHFDRAEKLTLFRDNRGYAVQTSDLKMFRFKPLSGESDEHRLISVEDLVGNTIHFFYNRTGCLQEIIDSGRRRLRFESDQHGRIAALFAPHPEKHDQWFQAVRYSYDVDGDLVEVIDALDQTSKYAYENHLIVQETDRNGLSFYFEYEGQGENACCTQTWGDGGIYDHHIKYDEILQRTTVVNSLGNKTVYHHDGALVLSIANALGAFKTKKYNEYFEVVAEKDEIGRKTKYTYDDRGNLIESEYPDGSKLSMEFNVDGLPIKSVDVVGGEWNLKYDQYRRIEEHKDSMGRITRFKYHRGLPIEMADPSGGQFTFSYDTHNNLTTLITPDGEKRIWNNDRLGRPILSILPTGGIEQRRFDLLGRVIQINGADGSKIKFNYDGEGSVVKITDNHGDILFTYQGMGRLASRTQEGHTIRFEYDTEEELAAVINQRGQSYRFYRDKMGRIIHETNYEGISRRYTRDAAGQVGLVDRPDGKWEKYARDAAGRVIEVIYSDGEKENYAYRPDGELILAANNCAMVSYERDISGLVTKETRNDHWVESKYDDLGLRVQIKSSLGADQQIDRGVMGDADKVIFNDRMVASFKRDALGYEIERKLPGGIQTRWVRDKIGKPISHEVIKGSEFKRFVSYKWGARDRLDVLNDNLNGPINFQYDNVGNLAIAIYPDTYTDVHIHDAVNNIYRSTSLNDREYGPSGQLLESRSSRGRIKYEYDKEGNLAKKIEENGSVWIYEWTVSGNLYSVKRPDSNIVKFGYDALGRRIFKHYRGLKTNWVWDGDHPLHEWIEGVVETTLQQRAIPLWSADSVYKEREENLSKVLSQGPSDGYNAETLITWIFEPDTWIPMAKIIGDEVFSIVTDHLGVPVSMYDSSGRTRWAGEISTYGKLRKFEGDNWLECPFRFPGQYEDAETGLFYNRFRYFDPDNGSYISQDPIGIDGGLALYSYVHNPKSFFDYFGAVDGGSYRSVRDTPRRGGRGEVHHTPANSVSPRTHGSGPAIWMTKADHRMTASHGHQGINGAAHRARQSALIQQGNWYRAIEMDVIDITQNIGHKYDRGIREMLDYAVDEGLVTRRQASAIIKKCGVT
jgi:RHS repeat-associated protein